MAIEDKKKVEVIRFLGTFIKRTGDIRKIITESSVLQKRGYEINVVLSEPPKQEVWRDMLKEAAIRLDYIARPKRLLDLAYLKKCARLFSRRKPMIMHCDNIHTIPLMAARIAGVKGRAWQKRSMNAASERLSPMTLRDKLVPRVRFSALNAHRIICVSESVASELRMLGISEKKVVVLNNTLDRIDQCPTRVDLAKRSNFGLSPDDIVLVAIGHTVPVKGWEELVHAFGNIASEVPQMKLVLVGSYSAPHERDTYGEIVNIINEQSISQRVFFTGDLDDVSGILSTADIYVLPSRSEGNAGSLLEAFRRGVPCISTRVGMSQELINDGQSGLLVERGNVEELGNAIVKFGSDKAFREQVRSNTVFPDWMLTPEERAEELADIYDSIRREVKS